jgi:hypothetical protein
LGGGGGGGPAATLHRATQNGELLPNFFYSAAQGGMNEVDG